MGGFIGNFLDDVVGLDDSGGIGGSLSAAADTITGAVTDVGDFVSDAASNPLVQAAITAYNPALGALVGGGSALDQGGSFGEAALDAFGNYLAGGGTFEGLQQGAENLFAGDTSFFDNLFGGIDLPNLGGIGSDVLGGITDLGTGLFDAVGGLGSDILGGVQGIGSDILGGLGSLGENIGGLFGNLEGNLGALGSGIADLAGGLTGGLGELGSGIVGLGSDILGGLGELGSGLFGGLQGGLGALGSGIGEIASNIGGFGADILGGLGNLGEGLFGGLGTLGGNILGGLSDVGQGIVGFGGDVLSGLGNLGEGLFSGLQGGLGGLGTGLLGGLGQLGQGLAGGLQNVANTQLVGNLLQAQANQQPAQVSLNPLAQSLFQTLASQNYFNQAQQQQQSIADQVQAQANALAQQVAQQGSFVPYSVTTALGQGAVSPTGQTTLGLSPAQQQLTDLLQQQALQSAQVAGTLPTQFQPIQQQALQGAQQFLGEAVAPTAQREQDIFNRLEALQGQARQQQQQALENRLFSQGRLGTQTSAFGGTPEQAAQAQAIQQQQAANALAAIQQAQAQQQAAQQAASGLFNLGTSAAATPFNLQQAALSNLANQQAQAFAPTTQIGNLFGLGAAPASQLQSAGQFGASALQQLGTTGIGAQQQAAQNIADLNAAQLAALANLAQSGTVSAAIPQAIGGLGDLITGLINPTPGGFLDDVLGIDPSGAGLFGSIGNFLFGGSSRPSAQTPPINPNALLPQGMLFT